MFRKSIALFVLMLAIAFPLKANNELLNILYENEGWKTLRETDEGITINYKKMDGYDLKALEIRQVVNVSPEQIISVLEDVQSYNDVLMGNRGMICYLVKEKDKTITGYQYYKIPLIRDRYAVFEMKKNYRDNLGALRSEWVLVPDKQHAELVLPEYHYEKSPLSINTGAGIWMFEKVGDNQWLAIHRLYMNPGGWIPDFIVERVNRKGVADLFTDVINAAKKTNEFTAIWRK